jgi:hypothetical protein
MDQQQINRKGLSPHQTETKKFPVVGEEWPSKDIEKWRLRVSGLVKNTLDLSMSDFHNLPMVERVWDTICVTGWTHLDHRWKGVMLSTLLAQAQPEENAHFVRFIAYSNRNHDTSLPLDYAREHVLLVTEVDGVPLTKEHGGPVRSFCDGKYLYKSLKWIKEIELLERDRLGYWETHSAYHNNADPWLEERLVPRPLSPEKFAECVENKNFSGVAAIRDDQFKQLKGIDMSEWNFQGASIKACDLENVSMHGANCRGANFTLTKFVGADLWGADFSGSDCEGADFRGANLSGADFRNTSLTVTRFTRRNTNIRGTKFSLCKLESEGFGENERALIMDDQNGAIRE